MVLSAQSGILHLKHSSECSVDRLIYILEENIPPFSRKRVVLETLEIDRSVVEVRVGSSDCQLRANVGH